MSERAQVNPWGPPKVQEGSFTLKRRVRLKARERAHPRPKRTHSRPERARHRIDRAHFIPGRAHPKSKRAHCNSLDSLQVLKGLILVLRAVLTQIYDFRGPKGPEEAVSIDAKRAL